ncbi:thimet oligopeptidase [Perkinsela sp. CCAP 1560/4]|nr:thimet oligopeptidase [Perkinsela sp. CCAP 1560/4]KNH08417.1 thimet oligopeptidase [Perkinsela sp. CCAP 1560/4]|eukprot:KNH06947.1 thimet oligopeptidase [Perkinsela sp. CCAP 1560/4]
MLPDVATISHCARLFPRTIEEVSKLATSAINEAKASIGKILDVTDENWISVVRARDSAISAFTATRDVLGIVKETAILKDVRSAASRNYVDMEGFFNANIRYNRDLEGKIRNFIEKNPGEYKDSSERAYYAKETLKEFRHLGLSAADAQFKKIQDMNADIQVVATKYDDAISADVKKIPFTLDELTGVPSDILNGLSKDPTDESSVLVGLDYPTYFAVQRACQVSSTREKLATAFENRAYPQNIPVLKNLLSHRKLFAAELGFKSYAAWDFFRNMAGDTSTVSNFLSLSVQPLQKKWRSELDSLLTSDDGAIKRTTNGKIKQSDIQFMMHRYKTKHLSVDENIIREYFPVDYTIPKIFEVLGSFFDVQFLRADYADFWADDVFAMTIICKRTESLLGHIICDLYPREGKYGHACCASIIPSEQSSDGSSHSPALAVVLANFPKKTSTSPGLLLHSDVETLFHEIGHALHAIYGRCEMTTVAAYNVKMDFIEVPSQFIEEWAWEKDILQKISCHYKTQAVLPEELINAKLKARYFFAGFSNLRQVLLGMYSLCVHQDDIEAQTDLDDKMRNLWESLFPEIEPIPNSHFSCSFGHLSGYGASYYSYHYSKAFAMDVLDYVQANGGLYDPQVGSRYKHALLGKGGSIDPTTIMRDFLGREPNLNAYWQRLGV